MVNPALATQGDLDIRVFPVTHVGRVRKANEDSFGVVDPANDPALLAARGRLVIVADGMGGTVGGAYASRMVVQVVRDTLYGDVVTPIEALMSRAIENANRAVHGEQLQRPELKGMGSTCTALVVHQGSAVIGHVGDSRAYMVRQGRILQLTDDHTKLRLLLESGMITQAEAANHPERSVLVRSIGPKPTVEVDVLKPVRLEDGDCLVVCSDGLINHVRDSEILATVEDRPEGEVAGSLVNLALSRGGTDNCTVVLVAVGRPAALPKLDAAAPSRAPVTVIPSEPDWTRDEAPSPARGLSLGAILQSPPLLGAALMGAFGLGLVVMAILYFVVQWRPGDGEKTAVTADGTPSSERPAPEKTADPTAKVDAARTDAQSDEAEKLEEERVEAKGVEAEQLEEERLEEARVAADQKKTGTKQRTSPHTGKAIAAPTAIAELPPPGGDPAVQTGGGQSDAETARPATRASKATVTLKLKGSCPVTLDGEHGKYPLSKDSPRDIPFGTYAVMNGDVPFRKGTTDFTYVLGASNVDPVMKCDCTKGKCSQ